MTLEELMTKLGDDSLKEAVVDLINKEKEKGIESYRKKDGEVLKYKGVLKNLGYAPEQYPDLDQFAEAVKTNQKAVSESKVTIATLNERLNEMQSNWNAEKEQTAQANLKAKNARIEAELTNKMGSLFFGSQYLIKDLINTGRADIADGVGVTIDGLDYDAASEKLRADHKDMLRVNQTAGTGGAGGAPDTGTLSLAEQIKQEMKL